MRSIIGARQRKHDLVKSSKTILEAAETAKRRLTPEEDALVEKNRLALEATEREIIEIEHQMAEEASMPLSLDENEQFARLARGEAPRDLPGKSAASASRGARYADLFGGRVLSNGGFESMNAFLKSWWQAGMSGAWDPRLRMASQGEDSFSTGGAFVPEQYAAALLDKSLEDEVIRPRAAVWPMTTESLRIPALDNFNQSSTLYGGFSAQWVQESGTIAGQTALTRQMKLIAKKLALLGTCSNELLMDASNFEATITTAMVKALGWFLDYYFINGNGAGQPLGILKDPALVTVTKDVSHVPGDKAILFNDLANMFARLHPSCLANSVWIANNTCIPALLALQFAVPAITGGFTQPAVTHGQNGEYTLFTRPVVFTTKNPTKGSKGDVILCDLTQYAIGLRTGMALERNPYSNFATDETVFRLLTRLDGQGTWKSAVTPKNGDSLSWVVVVEDRT